MIIRLQLVGVLLLPLAILLVVFSSVRAADDSKLVEECRHELAEMECPGALVGIAVGDKEPVVYTLGVADVDTKKPMQRDFHMRIASVSKPFLGTAILLLADDGKLSLDDPVAKYVDGVPAGDKITIRQLANNTSGLFNSIENKDFQAAIVADPQHQWQNAEILKYAFAKPAYGSPGENFRYSNTNAVVLSDVIEKVTGKPYADFVRSRVIEPLGLKHTGYLSEAAVPPPASSSYRNGYKNKWLGYGKAFYNVTGYSSSWAGAAGNMYSTVDDLLKAAKPLATGKLLSEKSRKELTKWLPTNYMNIQYGICLGELGGWIGHSGDVPGYCSYMGYSPKEDTSIVVLANLSNNKDGTSANERLRDIVIKHLSLAKK